MLSGSEINLDPVTGPAAIAKAADQLARKAQQSSEEQEAGYGLLARAASFRAKVQKVHAGRFVPLRREDHDFKYADWAIKDSDYESGTMAFRRSVSNPSEIHICYIVSVLTKCPGTKAG